MPFEAPRELSRPILKLVADGAPVKEIREAARSAKETLVGYRQEIEAAIDLLDNLITVHGRDGNIWSDLAEQVGRGLNIFLRADTLSGPERKVIDTSEIVQSLAEGGAMGTERDLAISVGNTLTHAGWTRVGTGLYSPPPKEKPEDD
jgi:hypothetical protein